MRPGRFAGPSGSMFHPSVIRRDPVLPIHLASAINSNINHILILFPHFPQIVFLVGLPVQHRFQRERSIRPGPLSSPPKCHSANVPAPHAGYDSNHDPFRIITQSSNKTESQTKGFSCQGRVLHGNGRVHSCDHKILHIRCVQLITLMITYTF